MTHLLVDPPACRLLDQLGVRPDNLATMTDRALDRYGVHPVTARADGTELERCPFSLTEDVVTTLTCESVAYWLNSAGHTTANIVTWLTPNGDHLVVHTTINVAGVRQTEVYVDDGQ